MSANPKREPPFHSPRCRPPADQKERFFKINGFRARPFLQEICASNLAALEVFDQLAFPGGEVETAMVDLASRSSIRAFAHDVAARHPKLDVLVNNAGISIEWDGKPTDVDKIRRTLEVNLIAPYAITEAHNTN